MASSTAIRLRQIRPPVSTLGPYVFGPEAVPGKPTIVRGPGWYTAASFRSRSGTVYRVMKDGSLRRALVKIPWRTRRSNRRALARIRRAEATWSEGMV